MVYLLTPKELEGVVGFEIVLYDVPGVLEKVFSIISDYNLNIYHVETCFRRGEEYGLFIAVDFTGKDVSPEKLIEEFKKKEFIKDAIVSPRFKNLIYPSKFCPMDLGGIRSIIVAEASMKGIIEGIKEEMGEEVGNAFLYRMGYEIGRKAYKLYAEKLGIKDFDEGIKVLKALARGAGWGDPKELIKKNDKIIVKAEHLWECEMQKGKVDKSASHLIRGIFTGFFKEFLNMNVKVRETKCIALGDPCCQFEINIIG